MVGWHHWRDGDEFEHTLGVGDGQGGLACCSPWGCKEPLSDWTELEIFPGDLVVKNPSSNAGDAGSIPGQGSHILQGHNQACVPQLLSPCTLEPVVGSTTREKPMHSNKDLVKPKKKNMGTSLVVHWLRLFTSNAQGVALIPDWGTDISTCCCC